MKVDKLIILLLIFFVSFTNMTVVYALEKNSHTILSYKKDVTGDKQTEQILVVADNQTKIINIISDKQKYSFSLGNPKRVNVIFQDLTQDGIKDVFVTYYGKNSKIAQNLLLAYENEQIIRVSLPETLDITAQFEDYYQASIKINQTKQSYTLNLQQHRDKLEKDGVFHQGVLNEPMELMVSPINSIHLTRLKDLSFGLKGRQFVDEGYGGAKLAYVDSTWKRVNGKWVLQKTSVKSS